MSQVSYEAFQSQKEARENRSTNGPRVSFFSLKNDGDEAVVRFMHDSPADFDIIYTHPAQINGRTRQVNCIREPHQPLTDCPFCAAKKPIQTKIYIHLLEYTKDDQGNVVATPKVWDRSSAYITTLKNLSEEYPPLSENVFKIKRNGVAGSVDTTYAIMYANPQIYRPDIYKKDATAFSNYKALGTAVYDKDYNGLMELLNGNTSNEQQPAPVQPAQTTTYAQPARSYQPAQPQPMTEQTTQPRTYNPGSVYIAGQQDANAIRPRRLD